ncbi:MAG: ribosome biogenesis GTPase Der [Veillonellaceae bacterium]|jgi:GTP-binding protein|nr:ribosome biogenesis GTPase Der [Veillonellaceae bacterium]
MAKPIVAIVGRPNVGKSTLFNRIAEKRVSIVDDTPGVTRDRIYADAEWTGHEFALVDTGGIDFDENDALLPAMRNQARLAMEEADVILFVVDGKVGITDVDEQIVGMLRTAKKPVVLAVNKVDSLKGIPDSYEFYGLGLGEPIAVSAVNALNLGDLLDAIVKELPENVDIADEPDTIRVAVVGRPNVGKSSLVNALLGEDRLVVSNIPGTTRDAVDTYFKQDGVTFVFVDTAGMRRRGKIDAALERYSVIRSLRAIDRADVVLMVIDAAEGVSEQDKKIAGYVHESGRASVLVVNKWDLVKKDGKTTLRYTETLRQELGFMQYSPVVFLSALTRQRVTRIPEVVKYVAEQHAMRVSTSLLNQVVRDAVGINPPPTDRGRKLKIYYATQAAVKPPTIVFFVNDPELMHFSYLRFLENQLREAFGFEGTPLKLVVRPRQGEE